MRAEPLRPVRFRLELDHPVAFVDLCGDALDWLQPTPLDRAGPHTWQAELELPVGCYAYKFRCADGTWLLDPHNPRTRAHRGAQNSLLVLDGCDEPLLHAPALPWLARRDDGLVIVRAGLRRGAGEQLLLRWREHDRPDPWRAQLRGAAHDRGAFVVDDPAWRRDPMELVAEEDEHLLFACRIPASATFDYLFELPDGRLQGRAGGAAQVLRADPASLSRPAPDWWARSVVYTVFVDRFRHRDGEAWPAPTPPPAEPHAPRPSFDPGLLEHGAIAGGDLWGAAAALPYLAELGVTLVHLTPIVPARSAHRYDATDFASVAPELGGDAAFDAFVNQAHALGLRVALDFGLNHVHRDHPHFVDVRRRGPASPYFERFVVQRWPFHDGPEPGYLHYHKGRWQEPLLNLDHPEVQAELGELLVAWVRRGIDALRLDAAAELPAAFRQRLARQLRAANPELAIFAEWVPDNPFRAALDTDAATDFVAQQALYDWLWRDQLDGEGLRRAWTHADFGCPGSARHRLHFCATHDQSRFRSLTGRADRADLTQFLTLMRAGVPALLYGDELGLACDAPARGFEDSWPDRQPMPWSELARYEAHRKLVASWIHARRNSDALSTGDEQLLALHVVEGDPAELFAVRRQAAHETVEVVLHRGAGHLRVELPDDAPSELVTLACVGDVQVDAATRSLVLGPSSGIALRRSLSDAHRAVWSELIQSSPATSRAAFVAGEVAFVGLPTRLYLTVTERCNARCRHCINHSPLRTEVGRARSLQPWLVERLRDGFRAAEYIAFSHGGESLVEPGFFALLDAIREAGGAPKQIHLLSNGVALVPDVAERLVDRGVSSIALSIDGASEATQALYRPGAPLAVVLHNARELVALRRASGIDLRVGVSCVLARDNLAELDSLAALVAELGLDWLKLEEMHPSNAFARAHAVNAREPRVLSLIERLSTRSEREGWVLVDHLGAHSGCACSAAGPSRDPALLRFLEADGFANRTRFGHCRMDWEQASIDPDGSMHAGDYDGPVLGRLDQHSLLELWQGPVMQARRRAVLAGVSEARRQACRM